MFAKNGRLKIMIATILSTVTMTIAIVSTILWRVSMLRMMPHFLLDQRKRTMKPRQKNSSSAIVQGESVGLLEKGTPRS